MQDSDVGRYRELLDQDYEEASFELHDRISLSGLGSIPKGEAIRLESVGFLFFDLRGFTRWAACKWDRSVFKVLHPSLRLLTRVVREHDGFVEKLTGDGMMVILGDEESTPAKVALRTLQCAIDFAAVLDEVINPFMLKKKHIEEPFSCGMGAEIGRALIAEMGFAEYRFPSSISDAANLASKCEDAAVSGEIRVGSRLYEALPEETQRELTAASLISDSLTYAYRPGCGEGGFPNLLALAGAALGGMTLGTEIYRSLENGKHPNITPNGTLSMRGGREQKDHRWYGKQ